MRATASLPQRAPVEGDGRGVSGTIFGVIAIPPGGLGGGLGPPSEPPPKPAPAQPALGTEHQSLTADLEGTRFSDRPLDKILRAQPRHSVARAAGKGGASHRSALYRPHARPARSFP